MHSIADDSLRRTSRRVGLGNQSVRRVWAYYELNTDQSCGDCGGVTVGIAPPKPPLPRKLPLVSVLGSFANQPFFDMPPAAALNPLVNMSTQGFGCAAAFARS